MLTIAFTITTILLISAAPVHSKSHCSSQSSIAGADWFKFDRFYNAYLYTCAEGYFCRNTLSLVPAQDRIAAVSNCKDSSWTPSACVKTCATPPGISNGLYLNSHCALPPFSNQTICKYICKEGYTTGKGTKHLRQAGRNYAYTQCYEGKWIYPPRCTIRRSRPECKQSELPATAGVQAFKCSARNGRLACAFKCPPGFAVSSAEGSASREGVATCAEGSWNSPKCVPSCRFKLPERSEATYLTDWCTGEAIANARCLYKCPPGYTIGSAATAEVMDGTTCGVLRCGEAAVTPCHKIEISQAPARSCKLPHVDLASVRAARECRQSSVARGRECVFECLNGEFEGTTLRRFASRCNGAAWLAEPADSSGKGLLQRPWLACSRGCAPLQVDANVNLQGSCSSSAANHEGINCVASCPQGTLEISPAASVAIRCSRGSWVHGDAHIIDCPIKCKPKPKPKSLPKPKARRCRPFAVGPGVRKTCRGAVSSSVSTVCKVWCHEANLKWFDVPELSLSCGASGWAAANPATGRAVDASAGFRCQKKCPPLSALSIGPAVAPNCAADRELPPSKRCQLICPGGVFAHCGKPAISTVCSDGSWSFTPALAGKPRCEVAPSDKPCGTLPRVADGVLTGDGCTASASHGTKCSFSCATGFAAEPTSNGDCECASGEIVCRNGAWETPRCVLKDSRARKEMKEGCIAESARICGGPPAITNGKLLSSSSSPPGLPMMRYVCADGFFAQAGRGEISDEATVECVRGRWQQAMCHPLSVAIENSGTAEVRLVLRHLSLDAVADATVLDQDGFTWKAAVLQNEETDGKKSSAVVKFTPLNATNTTAEEEDEAASAAFGAPAAKLAVLLGLLLI